MEKIVYLCLLVSLLPGQVIAKCDPSIAQHYPTNTPVNNYGNGQTDSFRCAATGSTDLTSLQQSERSDLIPESLYNRWYIMLGVNAGSTGVVNVSNKSIYDTQIENGVLNTTETHDASNNVEIAFGYAWKDFALDVEWLAVESLNYTGQITQISPLANIAYNTTLKGDALLMNLYWIFKDLYNFKFYGTMAAGVTSNKTTSTMGGGSATVVKKISPSLGLGFGARFNLVSSLYADMAARYIVLGRVKYSASNGTGNSMILKGYRTWAGVSARLLWMI